MARSQTMRTESLNLTRLIHCDHRVTTLIDKRMMQILSNLIMSGGK